MRQSGPRGAMKLGLGVTGAGCPVATGTGRMAGLSTKDKSAAKLQRRNEVTRHRVVPGHRWGRGRAAPCVKSAQMRDYDA